jgi:predicted small lipoprotein YifL
MIKVLLLLFIITGCSTKQPLLVPSSDIAQITKSPVSGKEVKQIKPSVEINKTLLEDCKPLPVLESDNPSAEEVLFQKKKDVDLYAECKLKQRSLVKLLRQALNVKEKI